VRDRLILHYSGSDWKVDRDRRWTWCGRFVPLERTTDRAEVVTCLICRRAVALGPRAVHG